MVALASPLVLTIPEAAEALGISRAKAYHLARAGQLPTVHFGRAVRVPVAELKELLVILARRSMVCEGGESRSQAQGEVAAR